MRHDVHLANLPQHRPGIAQRRILKTLDLHVRAEPDDFRFDFPAKAAHDGQGQQQRRHPDGHAAHCHIGNKPQKTTPFLSTLRADQVPKGYETMKRQGGAGMLVEECRQDVSPRTLGVKVLFVKRKT